MVTIENVCTVTNETSSLNQKMRKLNMFNTAVCFLFLIKLRYGPRTKVFDFSFAWFEFFSTEKLSVAQGLWVSSLQWAQ